MGKNSDGNLTQQSKLGIGLGVGLGVPFFIAIGAALFLWKRSLAQQKVGQANEEAKVGSSSGGGGPDSASGVGTETAPGYVPVPGDVQDAGAVPTELGAGVDNKPVHQLEANPARAELGGERVYELGS